MATYVRVWLDDIPEGMHTAYHIALAMGDCWRVEDLLAENPQSEFAFRSQALLERQCDKSLGMNPLLLDIDLDASLGRFTQSDLEVQKERASNYASERGWDFRVYHSGEGFHLEIAPQTVNGLEFMSTGNYWEFVRRVRRDLDASGYGKFANIDPPHEWIRVPGSVNRKGGVKVRVD